MKLCKIVDLAVMTDPDSCEPEKATFDRIYHKEGAIQAAGFFGLEPSDFPDSKLWANGRVNLGEHTGTHLDAPIHYADTTEGKPSYGIDEVPLEWCFGDGVVLDFHEKPFGYGITKQDVIDELTRIKYTIKPGDIVMIRNDADKRLYTEGYMNLHAGMTKEATEYICEQGVRVTGTDGWGWDIPFTASVKKYKETGDNSVLWEGHLVGKKYTYCHIEKLANLDKLPPYGFSVAVFPVKLKGGTAGWARPVAMFFE